MNINVNDVQLKTIANIPYNYCGITIQPKTINEIAESYDKFNENLSLISLTVKDILPKLSETDHYGYLLNKSVVETLLVTQNHDFLVHYLSAFEYFINAHIELVTDGAVLKINGALFEYSELEQISTILKIQNCVVNRDHDDFNPLNERARKLREKILQRQKN